MKTFVIRSRRVRAMAWAEVSEVTDAKRARLMSREERFCRLLVIAITRDLLRAPVAISGPLSV